MKTDEEYKDLTKKKYGPTWKDVYLKLKSDQYISNMGLDRMMIIDLLRLTGEQLRDMPFIPYDDIRKLKSLDIEFHNGEGKILTKYGDYDINEEEFREILSYLIVQGIDMPINS